MNKHREYLQYVESNCLRCHSCRCYHSTSLIGNVCYGELATLLLQNDMEELPKSIFGCHQCGMCLKKCPRKFNAKEFMFHARAYLEEQDETFCNCYSGVRVDREENMFARLRKENHASFEDALLGESDCLGLFVPGCHMSANFPELTNQVTAYLKEKDICDGMTAVCCGNPLYASGMYQAFEDYIKKMDHLYQEHHVKRITTPCPSCYDFHLRVQKMGYLEGVEIHCLSKDLVERGIRIRRSAFPMFASTEFASNFMLACIAAVASVGITFVLTLVFGWEDPVEEDMEDAPEHAAGPAEFHIGSPLNGAVIDLAEVKDETFSSGMLGQGIAVVPSEGVVYAPFDGVVTALFPSLHAIGLTDSTGSVEILIHVGMDTVELNGEGYRSFCKNGDQVKKGDRLITFDMEQIKSKGYDVTTPVIISNSPDFADIQVEKKGTVSSGESVLYLKK